MSHLLRPRIWPFFLACHYAPQIPEKYKQQLEGYQRMPDSVLFRVQQIEVVLSEFDLPGPTRRMVSCSHCGQTVRDHREVVVNGEDLCRPCAYGAYYTNAREITWPDMNWAPLSSEERAAGRKKINQPGNHRACDSSLGFSKA